jgi:hypothetical protein
LKRTQSYSRRADFFIDGIVSYAYLKAAMNSGKMSWKDGGSTWNK